MSLEAKIEALTLAVTALTEVMRAAPVAAPAATKEATKEKAAAKEKAPAASQEAKDKALNAAEANAALQGQHAPQDLAAKVKEAVLAVNRTKGRPQADAVLARFGASRITELAPESYADVLELATGVLEGRLDATKACDTRVDDDLV